MSHLGKFLVVAGAVAMVAGIALMLLGRANIPLGRLPGDIVIERGNLHIYFPIVTCIIAVWSCPSFCG